MDPSVLTYLRERREESDPMIAYLIRGGRRVEKYRVVYFNGTSLEDGIEESPKAPENGNLPACEEDESPLIWTIGHLESYLEAYRDHGHLIKVGRREDDPDYGDYPGGYAFRTPEDAQRRIDEAYPDRDFAIFAVRADWEEDTVPSEDGWWHHLIRDAPILIGLEDEETLRAP